MKWIIGAVCVVGVKSNENTQQTKELK